MPYTTAVVTGYMPEPNGVVFDGETVVTFTLDRSDVDATDDALIPTTPVKAILDGSGLLSVNLWPNARGAKGSAYEVRAYVTDTEVDTKYREIYFGKAQIPSAGGDIADFLSVGTIVDSVIVSTLTQGEYDAVIAAAATVQSAADAAAISEANAAASEANAAASATAASVAADFYADTAAGIAATVEGDQFWVPEGEINTRYEHQTGAVAVAVGQMPNTPEDADDTLVKAREAVALEASRQDKGRPKALVAILTGQSLNAGRGGSFAKTTCPNAYMLNGGAHVSAMEFWATNEEFSVKWADMASVTALSEGGEGQSPCVGVASMALGGSFERIYTGSVAIGARSVDLLFSGGPRANLYAMTERLCALARADGYDPVVAYSWRQGENDASKGTTETEYYDRCMSAFKMFQTCARQFMRNPSARVPIVVTLPMQSDAATTVIKTALTRVCRDTPDTILRGGVYDVPANTDLVHPTTDGYVLMGEGDGLALRRFFDDGARSGRVEVIDVTWNGATTATVVFNEAVQYDASEGVGSALSGTDGFEWFDNGTPVTISAVSVSGRIATLSLGSVPVGTAAQQLLHVAVQDTTPLGVVPDEIAGSYVRSTSGQPSIYDPTFTHYHWAMPQVHEVRSA